MKWHNLVLCELKGIVTNPAICLTLFGGLLFYSFLYPLPYLHQFPVEQRIAVIDDDNSIFSRKLIRMVDATQQVEVHRQALSREHARQLLESGDITGLLIIPKNFYRDILLYRSPTLVYAADASYFLVYGSIAEGITMAATALDSEIRLERRDLDKQPVLLPTRIENQPVFNPNTGYLNYVIPPVFLLILQQILLIAAGIHVVTLKEKQQAGEKLYLDSVSLFSLLSARVAAFAVLALPFFLFYLGACFSIYHIPRLANPAEFLLLLVPFLPATIFLGCILGRLLPRKELVIFVVLISSLPLVFTAGFIWPREQMPVWIHWLVQWVPFCHVAGAALELNQMGASFAAVAGEVVQLWGLLGLYFLGVFGLFFQDQEFTARHAEGDTR